MWTGRARGVREGWGRQTYVTAGRELRRRRARRTTPNPPPMRKGNEGGMPNSDPLPRTSSPPKTERGRKSCPRPARNTPAQAPMRSRRLMGGSHCAFLLRTQRSSILDVSELVSQDGKCARGHRRRPGNGDWRPLATPCAGRASTLLSWLSSCSTCAQLASVFAKSEQPSFLLST